MTVTLADLGAARVITWDRQERRNAWDLATMTAIADAIEVAGRDTAVRMHRAARRRGALLSRATTSRRRSRPTRPRGRRRSRPSSG